MKLHKVKDKFLHKIFQAVDYIEAFRRKELKFKKEIENMEMTNMERNELAERIKGMTREELEIVAENVPVDLCLKKIQTELNKANDLHKHLSAAMMQFDK